jgi:hypothetical protein
VVDMQKEVDTVLQRQVVGKVLPQVVGMVHWQVVVGMMLLVGMMMLVGMQWQEFQSW